MSGDARATAVYAASQAATIDKLANPSAARVTYTTLLARDTWRMW